MTQQLATINAAVTSLGLKRDYILLAVAHAGLEPTLVTGTAKRPQQHYNWDLLQAAIQEFTDYLEQPALSAARAGKPTRLDQIESGMNEVKNEIANTHATVEEVLEACAKSIEQNRLTFNAVTRFNSLMENVCQLMLTQTNRVVELDVHLMQLMARVDQSMAARAVVEPPVAPPTTPAPLPPAPVEPPPAPVDTRASEAIARMVESAGKPDYVHTPYVKPEKVVEVKKPKIAIVGILPANVDMITREFGDSFDITHYTNATMQRNDFNASMGKFEQVFLVDSVNHRIRRDIEKQAAGRVTRISTSVSSCKTALTAFFVNQAEAVMH